MVHSEVTQTFLSASTITNILEIVMFVFVTDVFSITTDEDLSHTQNLQYCHVQLSGYRSRQCKELELWLAGAGNIKCFLILVSCFEILASSI